MHLFKRQSSGVRRPSRRAAAACRKRWLLRALGAAAVLSMIAIRWGPCPDVRRAPLPASFAVTDASGGMLRQVLAADGSDCRPVALVDRESWIARAVVAAEDKRFWRHPGIDPLALLRALGQATLDELGQALADEAMDLVLRPQRSAKLGQHQVGGVGEIGDGVEQGAVEIEQHRTGGEARGCAHAATVASSARRAAMMES